MIVLASSDLQCFNTFLHYHGTSVAPTSTPQRCSSCPADLHYREEAWRAETPESWLYFPGAFDCSGCLAEDIHTDAKIVEASASADTPAKIVEGSGSAESAGCLAEDYHDGVELTGSRVQEDESGETIVLRLGGMWHLTSVGRGRRESALR